MKKVLFLCNQNSSRSQMAEAILNSKGKGKFIAHSAGKKPAETINPYAVLVMNEVDIDISSNKPKSIEMFLEEEFDFIITLCDKWKDECPVVSNGAVYIHWGISNLSCINQTDDVMKKQFRKIRNELISRINIFLSLPVDKIDKMSFKQKLNERILIEENGCI